MKENKSAKQSVNDISHDWKLDPITKKEVCKKCGIVRRIDRKNRHCRGKIKIGLRSLRSKRIV